MTEGLGHGDMRAVQFDSYGGPGVLALRTLSKVTPRDGEMLIRVRATSVNQHDVFVRSGQLRIASGRRFPLGIGVDFAGEVVSTSSLNSSNAGDRVWGTMPGIAHRSSGTAADLVSIGPEQVSQMPPGMSFTDAVSMVAGGTAALTALSDMTALQPGERVLIRGGTGTVGNFAVQYASKIGAHVTTIVGEKNRDVAEELGAHVALDRAVATDSLGEFDVILDTVGTDMHQFRRRLAREGRMVTVAFSSVSAIAYIAASTVHRRRRVRAFLGAPKSHQLSALADVIAEHRIIPLINAVYPLEDIAEAHRAVETGGTIGKHVLQLTW